MERETTAAWGEHKFLPFIRIWETQTKHPVRTKGSKSGNLRENQQLSQPVKTQSLWREGPDTAQHASAAATLYEPDSKKTECVQRSRICGHDGSHIFLGIMIHSYCFGIEKTEKKKNCPKLVDIIMKYKHITI